MNVCIPGGYVFFPVAARSNRCVAPSSNPLKAKAVKPNAPRVRRGRVWDVIEPLRNRAINAILNFLPRNFVENRVAGHIDALINAMADAGKSGETGTLERMIADINTLSSGLDCMEIYREQIRAKVHILNPEQFSLCFEVLKRCVNVHPDNQCLKIMEEHFSVCKENETRFSAYFNKIFGIKIAKGVDLDVSFLPIRLLSAPAQNLGFPEGCASLESLAQDVVKKMDNRELECLASTKVHVYTGLEKEWAAICCKAAKSQLDYLQSNENEKQKKVRSKLRGPIKSIANSFEGLSYKSDQDGMLGANTAIAKSMASQIMNLARTINSLDVPFDGEGIKGSVETILKEIPEAKNKIREKAFQKDEEGVYVWREVINTQILVINGGATRKGVMGFNFNPNKIPNPISPKGLVDLICDASS